MPCAANQALDVAHQAAIKKLLDGAKDNDVRRLIQMDVDRAKQDAVPKPTK
jgi:hypothetical protein